MANTIVTVNVSQTVAPTPSTLQKMGALISQGATTTAAGSYTMLTQLQDLTSILTGALSITSMAWGSSVVTVTTTAPHGFTTADTLPLTISGVTPAGYNGTFTCTITGANTFTYPLVSNPGTATVQGKYTPEDVNELLAMATTFFAQGSQQAVYVLELGAGNATDGAAALTTWLTANPGIFYSYLVPRTWDANSSFLSLLASFESTTAKTYFYITSTVGTYTSYTALMKCAFVMIEAPGVAGSLEFSNASAFWVTLNYNPSNTNKVTPTAFSYVYGVTPYPVKGNGALFASLKTAGVNIIGTGAEGGISNAMLLWGTTMDVRDFTYWYSVDWVQINIDLAVANAVINGSNNPINPLYYNQDGINRLQATAVKVMNSGVAFGLVLFPPKSTNILGDVLGQNLENGVYNGYTVVNAVPFIPYSQSNPGDYKIGKYAGLSTVYTPNRGFTNIVFNINVTDFVAV